MQIARKSLSAFVLAICLLAALAFGASTAAATVITDWPPDEGTTCDLTVVGSGNPDMLAELDAADMTVTAYRIADAAPNSADQAFTYKFRSPYGTDTIDAPLVTEGDEEARLFWKNVAESAMVLIDDDDDPYELTKVSDKEATFSATGLQPGIYLIVVNAGASPEERNVVYGELNKYTFSAQAIALPTKAPNKDGVIASSNQVPWDTELEAVLKSEQEPLYGDIRINKSVLDFWGDESATFVYHLVGTTPKGDAYDNYASITWPEETFTIVTHIPAGTELTVTEIDPGPRFEQVPPDYSAEATIVSSAAVKANKGKIAEVSFANKPNGSGKGGHGIQNNFELVPEGSSWQWKWNDPADQDNSETQG